MFPPAKKKITNKGHGELDNFIINRPLCTLLDVDPVVHIEHDLHEWVDLYLIYSLLRMWNEVMEWKGLGSRQS